MAEDEEEEEEEEEDGEKDEDEEAGFRTTKVTKVMVLTDGWQVARCGSCSAWGAGWHVACRT